MTEIFRQLNDEWSVLRCVDVSAWSEQHDCLRHCRNADEVLAAVRLNSDAVLRCLVSQAQQGNELAGRIVVQAMAGKLVRMAGTGIARTIPTAGDDLVMSLWAQIKTMRLERQRNVPASLALGALNAAQRFWAADCEQPPEGIQVIHLVDQDPTGHTDVVDITAHDVLDGAEERGLLDEVTIQLMRTLYADGNDVAQAAELLRVSPQTIYRHRRNALKTLQDHATSLIAA